MNTRIVLSWVAGSAVLGVALDGCGSEGGLPANAADFVSTYANLAHAGYADTRSRLEALEATAVALVAAPRESTLASARGAWLLARDPYLQTEAFRFSGGPIEHVDDYVNAWPLNEAHLDYVEGNTTAGLVNDPAFVITGASLEGENMPAGGGESDVAVGFHAIEFLLWGQDGNDDGPGDRPATDYDTGAGGTAQNQARRGLVLTTAAGGGERLVGLDTHDQEDEHSCFSDNTHRDFVMDAIGVENVYLGRVVRTDGTLVSGTGLYDVLGLAEPTAPLARRGGERARAS